MQLNSELSYISISKFVIHASHPVMSLGAEVRLRLLNIYSANGEARISRDAVSDRLVLSPIHISGSRSRPAVIANWSGFMAAKLMNLDEVPCINHGKISPSKLERIVTNDFFLDLSFQKTDMVTQRIRSIVLSQHLEKHSVKSMLTMDFKSPREFFEVPVVRKRDALVKVLEKSNENIDVMQFILSEFDTKRKSEEVCEANYFGPDILF